MPDNSFLTELLAKALELTGKLERPEAMKFFVDTARELTGAHYSALGVLDAHGDTVEFFFSGLDATHASKIGSPPAGLGIIAEIPAQGALIINDLPHHPRAAGYPKHHPHMENFLGVIVPVNEQVWGRLYLTDKPGGFTKDDATKMEMLAHAASIAVQNSYLYTASQNRARWLAASQNIVSSLLEGTEEEESLQVITEEMRIAARADVALMILPSIKNNWMCEIVAGAGSEKFRGLNFPPDGRAQTVIREQNGLVIDSMQRLTTVRIPLMREYGPALYAPLVSKGVGRGVIILLRHLKAAEFDLHDLTMAENVAQQAAFAMELVQARHAQEMALELDERARIARDLHDLAIQQLFASGMHITAVKEDLDASASPEVKNALDNAIWALDESVTQIRKIVRSLRDDSPAAALLERLQHETTLSLQSLGFAPSLIIRKNGEIPPADFDYTTIDDLIGADIADDVTAVVREGLSGVARHAHAASVIVEINVDAQQIEVQVLDDGVGITAAAARRSGLANLAARARRHHGSFTIGPRRDGTRGTRTYWQVPLA